jgi:AcrR family transcriptional regulator
MKAMTAGTPASPTRRGPAATKHIDIMWAAIRLFARKGIAQTTTREIAAEAQTTERTLFKHFGSKELLLHAVISEAVVANLAPTSLAALTKAIGAHAGDLASWHASLLRSRGAAMAADPELTRLLLVEVLRDERVREQFAAAWLTAVWHPLTTLFEKLQADGTMRKDIPAETLCRTFLSLNIGYLVGRYVLAPALAWDDAREIKSIAAVFAQGVMGENLALKSSRSSPG